MHETRDEFYFLRHKYIETLIANVPETQNTEFGRMSSYAFDGYEIVLRFFKYIFEGIIVAMAAYFIPGRKLDVEEIFVLALIAAATFAVLDLFAPAVGASVRTGAGWGIGMNLVGFPGGAPVVAG